RAGYRLCFDPLSDWAVAIHWDTATRRDPADFSMAAGRPVLNRYCMDVGKELVSQLFAAMFGYDILVDPLHHEGPAVRKSNENATHDGEVVECPIAETEPGFVYQRLIANDFDTEFVEDLRVPFICGRIPFVYHKLRPRGADRFWHVTDAWCDDT